MRLHATLFALAASALLASGCQSIKPPDWAKPLIPGSQPKLVESRYASPARLAVLWSPAMLNNPSGKPTRGFGGRIYFYDAKNGAVPVEGQLVVYAYNNDNSKPESRTPDRKFAFTPEQFTQHYSPTQLGASYSIWIPWDEVGNAQVELSLLPIFTATNGQLIVGESSKCLLPGPTTESSPLQVSHQTLSTHDLVERQMPAPHGVQPVTYLAPPTQSNLQPNAPSDLTLRLPNSLVNQLGAQRELPQQMPGLAAVPAQPLMRQTGMTTPPTAAAMFPAQSPSNQPSARFLRPISPAQTSPGLPPVAGRLPSRPSPAGWPSGPASPPAAPAPQSGSPAGS